MREEFLNQYWAKYPENPRNALRFGRVYQMRLGSHHLVDWTAIEGKQHRGADVLIDGDLIAVLPGAQFILLAPNLTDENLFYSLENDPWQNKKRWYDYQKMIRDFFVDKKFLEVKTPTLVSCPGTEPSLEVFVTEYVEGSKKQKFFLPTSPELNLKKLISYGAEKVFEIASVFRNGEKTNKHHFEFTMLEWYRAYAQLSSIKHDTIALVEYLSQQMQVEAPKETLTFTVAELFKKYCDFDLKPETTEEELKHLAQKLNVDVRDASCIDDYFYLIFMDKIEYQWPEDRLVFVEKYPPYQAALARLDHQGWADRFEVYWRGLELGNAFHELTDPTLQRKRALEDLDKKKQMGKTDISLDEDFFKALDRGMPPSAGIAVGLERLFMALLGIKDISKITGSRIL